ncbi:MAG: PAS domain S-box protein, partial [Owenweeksia sp.]
TYLEFPVINSRGKVSWIGQTVEMVITDGVLYEALAVACDVTDKIIANQFSANSEEKYRHLIENIRLGLMEVDLEERVLFVNHSFCEITGYSPEEIIGKKASEVFIRYGDTENLQQIEAANKKRLQGDFSAYELKIEHKDGEPVWLIISGAPVRNSQGKIIGSVGIHHDITERKLKELERKNLLQELESSNQELKKKQRYLSAVNEFAARLIKTSTIHEIVTEITRNTIEKFGFEDCVVYLLNEEEDFLEQITAYGIKEHEGQVVEPIRIPVGKGIVGSVALHGKPEIVNDTTRDERYIFDLVQGLSEMAVPIIANGKVIGVIDSENPAKNFYTNEHLETLITISNLAANKIKSAIITQKREEAEAALKKSEAKLRAVINSALDAMIIINEDGIVQEWNPQAKEIFGYSKKVACGNKMTDLIIHQPFRRIMEMGIQTFTESGKAS